MTSQNEDTISNENDWEGLRLLISISDNDVGQLVDLIEVSEHIQNKETKEKQNQLKQSNENEKCFNFEDLFLVVAADEWCCEGLRLIVDPEVIESFSRSVESEIESKTVKEVSLSGLQTLYEVTSQTDEDTRDVLSWIIKTETGQIPDIDQKTTINESNNNISRRTRVSQSEEVTSPSISSRCSSLIKSTEKSRSLVSKNVIDNNKAVSNAHSPTRRRNKLLDTSFLQRTREDARDRCRALLRKEARERMVITEASRETEECRRQEEERSHLEKQMQRDTLFNRFLSARFETEVGDVIGAPGSLKNEVAARKIYWSVLIPTHLPNRMDLVKEFWKSTRKLEKSFPTKKEKKIKKKINQLPSIQRDFSVLEQAIPRVYEKAEVASSVASGIESKVRNRLSPLKKHPTSPVVNPSSDVLPPWKQSLPPSQVVQQAHV